MENLNNLYQVCNQVFSFVADAISVFVLPLFLSKVIAANVSGEGSKALSSFKGVVAYFGLVAAFPYILELLFAIPKAFLPELKGFAENPNNEKYNAVTAMVPHVIDRVFEGILAWLYWIAYYLHVFFIMIMASMAPIVFMAGTLLGVGLGIEVFLGLLILGSSWPVVWYGFDQVHFLLASTQPDVFAARCLEFLVTLGKGIGPLVMAAAAIKSPVGRGISTAISMGRDRIMHPVASSGLSNLGNQEKSRGNRVFNQTQVFKTDNNKDLSFARSSGNRLAVARVLQSQFQNRVSYENTYKRNT